MPKIPIFDEFYFIDSFLVDLAYFPGKDEFGDYSEEATGNFIPSISAEKTDESVYDAVNSDFHRSLRPVHKIQI